MAMLLLLIATLTVAGCGSKEADAYRIGVILSLSGPSSSLGQPEQNAIRIVEEELAAAGGIDGKPVEFIYIDDKSEPVDARTAAKKLIEQDEVQAIIGCSSSGASLSISSVVQEAGVPTIALAAEAAITEPVKSNVFSVAPKDALIVKRILQYFQDELKVGKVALVHDSNSYGTSGAKAFVDLAPGFDIEIASKESYASADTDMTAQLTKVKESGAEALLIWGTNPGAASVAKNASQLNLQIPVVASSGIANQTFMELAGDAANGVVFCASKLVLPETIEAGTPWRESVDRFNALYLEKYKQPISTFAAHGWDAVNLIVDAMKDAGTDRAAIRDKIESFKDYPGVDGVFSFSEKDHAGLTVDALVMVRIVDGKWSEL